MSGTTPYPSAELPAITAEQMREVDRVMVDELGIQLVQMMENAGRSLADVAITRYHPSTCTVLAGSGGNGGGGLVAARQLHNRGVAVTVALDLPSELDATTGRVGNPCIVADATLTLALPKIGLRVAPQVVGDLFVADISVPPSVYEPMGLHLPAPFAAGPILRTTASSHR